MKIICVYMKDYICGFWAEMYVVSMCVCVCVYDWNSVCLY